MILGKISEIRSWIVIGETKIEEREARVAVSSEMV